MGWKETPRVKTNSFRQLYTKTEGGLKRCYQEYSKFLPSHREKLTVIPPPPITLSLPLWHIAPGSWFTVYLSQRKDTCFSQSLFVFALRTWDNTRMCVCGCFFLSVRGGWEYIPGLLMVGLARCWLDKESERPNHEGGKQTNGKRVWIKPERRRVTLLSGSGRYSRYGQMKSKSTKTHHCKQKSCIWILNKSSVLLVKCT